MTKIDVNSEHEIARNEPTPDEWKTFPSKLHEWFKQTLKGDDPKPSVNDCYELADQIARIVHRHENAELQKRYAKAGLGDVPAKNLRNFTLGEIEDKQRAEIANCAADIYESMKKLEGLLSEVENFWGPNVTFNNVPIYEFSERIFSLKLPIIGLASLNERPPKKSRGDHETSWHRPAREIAPMIREILKDYCNNRSLTDADSATIQITTCIINFLFRGTKKVTPDALVSALRKRDRRRKAPPVQNRKNLANSAVK